MNAFKILYVFGVILQMVERNNPSFGHKPEGKGELKEHWDKDLNITLEVEVQTNGHQESWENYSAKLTDNVRGLWAWLEKWNLAVVIPLLLIPVSDISLV